MSKLVQLALTLSIGGGVLANSAGANEAPQLAWSEAAANARAPSNFDSTTPFGAVLFRSDSAAIEQPLWPVLRGAIALAKQHPRLVIELEGHADVRGSRNHNRTLSFKRVKSVTDYLVRHGIPTHRIETRAYGESRASANVNDKSGHIFDRRVTITLRSADGAA